MIVGWDEWPLDGWIDPAHWHNPTYWHDDMMLGFPCFRCPLKVLSWLLWESLQSSDCYGNHFRVLWKHSSKEEDNAWTVSIISDMSNYSWKFRGDKLTRTPLAKIRLRGDFLSRFTNEGKIILSLFLYFQFIFCTFTSKV